MNIGCVEVFKKIHNVKRKFTTKRIYQYSSGTVYLYSRSRSKFKVHFRYAIFVVVGC